MIRNANSSVIWLSSYKCQWQPVCCVGNSSNRLTTAQFHGSGGGRQTAALSAVISKGAKRPFQRQLGVGVLKGEGDAIPGGRQAHPGVPRDANMSACSMETVNPTEYRGQKISQGSQKDAYPSQSTGHSTWVPGTTASTNTWSLVNNVKGPQRLQGMLRSSRTLLQMCLVCNQMRGMLLFTWSPGWRVQSQNKEVRKLGRRGHVVILKAESTACWLTDPGD